MKTVNLPTTVLIDQDISYEAKGVYCYLYSRQANNFPIDLTKKGEKKWEKSIRELIKNGYIEIEKDNVFFRK
jgi:exonuclease I